MERLHKTAWPVRIVFISRLMLAVKIMPIHVFNMPEGKMNAGLQAACMRLAGAATATTTPIMADTATA
jgi:hypothetical protein